MKEAIYRQKEVTKDMESPEEERGLEGQNAPPNTFVSALVLDRHTLGLPRTTSASLYSTVPSGLYILDILNSPTFRACDISKR